MITVVSGIPNSGADLMMQMLEAGGMPALSDDARASGLENKRDRYASAASQLLPREATWLAAAEGRACMIDLEQLYHLPASREYRVVFMLRDVEQAFPSPPQVLSPAGAEEEQSLELVRHGYRRHARNVQRWLEGPRQIATCYCCYEEMLHQPLTVARQVAAFLGLRMDTRAMAFVIEQFMRGKRCKNKETMP